MFEFSDIKRTKQASFKKMSGLLILFVHSKHCKSSRGLDVCQCVFGCVQQQGGRAGPFLLSFGSAPLMGSSSLVTSRLDYCSILTFFPPQWRQKKTKRKEILLRFMSLLEVINAFKYSDAFHFKVNRRLLPFTEAHHTPFSASSDN